MAIFEYSYSLSVGEEEIIDVYKAGKKLVIDFRVKFVVKGREGVIVEVDSERYGIVEINEECLRWVMEKRLSDYWTPHEQACELINEAAALSGGKDEDRRPPTVVDLMPEPQVRVRGAESEEAEVRQRNSFRRNSSVEAPMRTRFHYHCILRRLREVDPHCRLLPYDPTDDPLRYPKPDRQKIRLHMSRLTED